MIDAPVSQLFSGMQLSSGNENCECTSCARILREGEQVRVYAARPEGDSEWRLDRIYCRDCTPTQITAPTLGVTELLLHGRIGRLMDVSTQSGQQAFLDVQPVTRSPPRQGTAEADDEQVTALLLETLTPYEAVYHIDDGNGTPLCNSKGAYISMSVNEAKERGARQCRTCESIQTKHQHTHTCPHCNVQIGASAWPQHVRTCSDGTGD